MSRYFARTERKRGRSAGLMGLAMLTLPSLSHALSIELSDGTNTFSCTDGAACEAGAPSVDGVMTFAQTVGSWLTSVTTGLSKPTVGSALLPSLQLTNVSVSGDFGSGVPPLTIKLSEQGFTTPDALNAFDFSMTATLNGMAAIVSAYADNNNTLFGTGTLLGSSPTFQDPNPNDNSAPAFLYNSQVAGSTVQPFSLTLIATLSNPALGVRNSSLSGTLNYNPVPIPAAVWLLGSALAGMGVIGRRNKAAMA